MDQGIEHGMPRGTVQVIKEKYKSMCERDIQSSAQKIGIGMEVWETKGRSNTKAATPFLCMHAQPKKRNQQ
jgi:hypothetical protein